MAANRSREQRGKSPHLVVPVHEILIDRRDAGFQGFGHAFSWNTGLLPGMSAHGSTMLAGFLGFTMTALVPRARLQRPFQLWDRKLHQCNAMAPSAASQRSGSSATKASNCFHDPRNPLRSTGPLIPARVPAL